MRILRLYSSIVCATCLLLAANLWAAAPSEKPLQIYFVDVEGGQATLFVTPEGQSLLIDTGWDGHNKRDSNRIMEVIKKAGISKIDVLVLTHYHEDHAGGLAQLAAMIPIHTFIDHGPNSETADPDVVRLYNAYQKELTRGDHKHIVAKPGDKLPIQGIDATVVSSNGNLIAHPFPGAGEPNSACRKSESLPADHTENVRSIGVAMTFGKLRILDLGDLTWDKELELMCPVNKIGNFDVYIVSHHGWDHSGSPALVWGIHPQVAIMDNGPRKGGTPSIWAIIHQAPGLEDLWQLHTAEEEGAKNVPAKFIANLKGPEDGHYIELSAWRDGHYEVMNSRTGETKKYRVR